MSFGVTHYRVLDKDTTNETKNVSVKKRQNMAYQRVGYLITKEANNHTVNFSYHEGLSLFDMKVNGTAGDIEYSIGFQMPVNKYADMIWRELSDDERKEFMEEMYDENHVPIKERDKDWTREKLSDDIYTFYGSLLNTSLKGLRHIRRYHNVCQLFVYLDAIFDSKFKNDSFNLSKSEANEIAFNYTAILAYFSSVFRDKVKTTLLSNGKCSDITDEENWFIMGYSAHIGRIKYVIPHAYQRAASVKKLYESRVDLCRDVMDELTKEINANFN